MFLLFVTSWQQQVYTKLNTPKTGAIWHFEKLCLPLLILAGVVLIFEWRATKLNLTISMYYHFLVCLSTRAEIGQTG